MKNVLSVAGAIVVITLAVLFSVLLVKMSIGLYHGTVSAWQSAQYTPEDEKRNAQADAEWAKDPRNPKVVGQKCLDAGGIPDYSSWDGDVKSCTKPDGNGKNVNIEVRQ